jgi:UDP-N-acetylglucosamine:LPS N-acetylglucosamine transferase
MTEINQKQSFVFVFPMFSGHINPSLPIARSLGKLGHEVHYVCAEQMREAIEGTGAIFHSDVDVEPELFKGRSGNFMGLIGDFRKEYGIEDEPIMKSFFKLRNIILELRMPGMIRFLQETKPAAVVYDPISSLEAAWAAKFQGIVHISLNTIAGPGAWTLALGNFAKQASSTVEGMDQIMQDFQPNMEAHKRLQLHYGCEGDGGLAKPYGMMPEAAHAAFTLVTTSEDLYDPITPEMQKAIEADDVKFVAVGPLLDEAGAKRAGGHKSNHDEQEPKDASSTNEEILERVASARKSGRAVVLASMGTVITGDLEGVGWEGRSIGRDGQPRGLTGRQLCQGAWSGVFDAFGADNVEEGPLIVLALGPQQDPLGEIAPPPNAICVPVVPQVDVLKAGVDLFLTHGGQNSFTESLASATPVVVCPGFGDQIVNAQKAVDIGVGLKVDRPDPDAGHEKEAAAAYRADVTATLRAVFASPDFKASAKKCCANLQRAGDLPRAVQLVLAASQGVKNSGNEAAYQAGA